MEKHLKTNCKYTCLLQSKFSGFISKLWMPRVESGICMMPQKQISLVILLRSNSLGLEICLFFKWWVLGRFWVGFWWDPHLCSCWISPTLRRLQSQESRNPGSVFTIALDKPTQCYVIMKPCSNTWDIGVLHIMNLESFKNRCQAANCSFSPGPRSTAMCVADVHLWIQRAVRDQFLREQKDSVPFWLHKFYCW